ncbi:MAG TPA: hypothetical protein PKX80_09495 [Flexilinea sp.]|nr:hypothetical protein [Flexilinea sp.]HQG89737.1 hypothetical protein [Flexilinea sp.]
MRSTPVACRGRRPAMCAMLVRRDVPNIVGVVEDSILAMHTGCL